MSIIRGFAFPEDLFYLVEHDSWVRLDPDGNATVGITSLGAHISGTFIDFMAKREGEHVERERSLGLLEMSKVIRSIRAPVAGVIMASNAAVKRNPGLINAHPYDEGWLVRLRPLAWEADRRLLVTGTAVASAVEAYMGLLAESFGEEPPP
ncbi:MAG TPA: glycine cleavage system protein H [Casimicrobiaceae bacterium]|nr:glycine cleavage system protein H [Casimicrobiaceae bacterium]